MYNRSSKVLWKQNLKLSFKDELTFKKEISLLMKGLILKLKFFKLALWGFTFTVFIQCIPFVMLTIGIIEIVRNTVNIKWAKLFDNN